MHECVSGEIVGATHAGGVPRGVGELRRRVQRLKPVHVDGYLGHVRRGKLVPGPNLGHQVYDRTVVARRLVDLGCNVEHLPPSTQVCHNVGNLRSVGTLEHVG